MLATLGTRNLVTFIVPIFGHIGWIIAEDARRVGAYDALVLIIDVIRARLLVALGARHLREIPFSTTRDSAELDTTVPVLAPFGFVVINL